MCLPSADVQGWEELMLILESSMAGGRREVAVAAMSVLVTVMQANGGSKSLKREMWKRALRAVGVGVEAAASPQCMVPLQARLELVSSVGHLHVRSLPILGVLALTLLNREGYWFLSLIITLNSTSSTIDNAIWGLSKRKCLNLMKILEDCLPIKGISQRHSIECVRKSNAGSVADATITSDWIPCAGCFTEYHGCRGLA